MFFPCKLTRLPSLVDSVVRGEWYFRLDFQRSVSWLVFSSCLWTAKCHWSHLPRDRPSLKRLLSRRQAFIHTQYYQTISLICAVCSHSLGSTLWFVPSPPLSFHSFFCDSCHFFQCTALMWLLFFFSILKVVIIPTWCLSELNLAQTYAFERHKCNCRRLQAGVMV